MSHSSKTVTMKENKDLSLGNHPEVSCFAFLRYRCELVHCGKPWALDLGEEVDSFRAFCYIVKLSKPEPLGLASLAINWESQ